MNEQIKLLKGDCLELMKDIPDNSIDLIVTDPPYKLVAGGVTGKLSKRITGVCLDHNSIDTKNGNGNFKINNIKFSEWLPDCYRVLKDGGHCYIMVNDRNMQQLLNETETSGFKLLNILVWNKNNAMPNHWYMKNAEFILFLRKGIAKYINNQGSKQCMYFNNIKSKLHPTEKPVELMSNFIENSTKIGDTVLDPFMGSGTTAIACINTGRNFIDFELDKHYCDIANERIRKALAGKEVGE